MPAASARKSGKPDGGSSETPAPTKITSSPVRCASISGSGKSTSRIHILERAYTIRLSAYASLRDMRAIPRGGYDHGATAALLRVGLWPHIALRHSTPLAGLHPYTPTWGF